eukprot:TRINITY_DN7339_c0_g1_i3.p1 TRINITY_DN7339_c0_g1~~TRINITY_DN7339_c0_g1_i3.p1  ORF type:complete len:125 (+),score=21.63 TRINITY_DN7339_c0_g1_i3:103-477(+)
MCIRDREYIEHLFRESNPLLDSIRRGEQIKSELEEILADDFTGMPKGKLIEYNKAKGEWMLREGVTIEYKEYAPFIFKEAFTNISTNKEINHKIDITIHKKAKKIAMHNISKKEDAVVYNSKVY